MLKHRSSSAWVADPPSGAARSHKANAHLLAKGIDCCTEFIPLTRLNRQNQQQIARPKKSSTVTKGYSFLTKRLRVFISISRIMVVYRGGHISKNTRPLLRPKGKTQRNFIVVLAPREIGSGVTVSQDVMIVKYIAIPHQVEQFKCAVAITDLFKESREMKLRAVRAIFYNFHVRNDVPWRKRSIDF
jgi:hypothetical protein